MVFASTVVLGGGGTFLGEVEVFMSVKVFLGGAGSQKGMPEAIASFFFTRFSIKISRKLEILIETLSKLPTNLSNGQP